MNTSALFVAVPAVDDPVNDLSQEAQAHITLPFFGDASGLSEELQLQLLEVLDEMAQSFGPFEAAIAGTAVLGQDKAGVLLIESAELVAIRAAMNDNPVVQEAQANAERQFPWWIPHLTMTYGKPVPDGYPESIRFDRIGFWSAEDKVYAPLEAPSEDSVTAGICIPPVWDVDDLSLGIRVASGDPSARWYVSKRAEALGQMGQIPQHWSSA